MVTYINSVRQLSNPLQLQLLIYSQLTSFQKMSITWTKQYLNIHKSFHALWNINYAFQSNFLSVLKRTFLCFCNSFAKCLVQNYCWTLLYGKIIFPILKLFNFFVVFIVPCISPTNKMSWIDKIPTYLGTSG